MQRDAADDTTAAFKPRKRAIVTAGLPLSACQAPCMLWLWKAAASLQTAESYAAAAVTAGCSLCLPKAMLLLHKVAAAVTATVTAGLPL